MTESNPKLYKRRKTIRTDKRRIGRSVFSGVMLLTVSNLLVKIT